MSPKLTAVLNAIDEIKTLMIGLAKDEPSLARTYRDDHASYVRIENLLRARKAQQAQSYARGLDSIVRDRLPDAFWRLTDEQAARP
jgi:hypothetical protein